MKRKNYGNTAQFGRADCAVDFFVRLYRVSAGNLTVVKENLCKMTEQRSSKTRIRICAVLPYKILALLLAPALLFSVCVSVAAAFLGDVNRDGKVRATDARTVLRAAARLETLKDGQVGFGDVNGNGRIDSGDARLILRMAAGLDALKEIDDTEAPTGPEMSAPAAEDKMTVLDLDGARLGGIDRRANCSAVDGGIFYSIFAPEEYRFTANAEYRFFNQESGQNIYLGTLENQGYEAFFTRTEYNGKIYTLAVVGNPMGDAAVPLVLLAFDPVAGSMKTHTVSENGFPYASMAVSGGKLLIMNHEMTEPKRDKLYAFDPETETVEEVLTFASATDSLRGVCAAKNGFFLLRLKINAGKENEMFLDRYDGNCGKVSERSVNEMLMKAMAQIPGNRNRQDALNELGMNVAGFAVEGDRYLFYENFGTARLIVDLETGEAVFAKDDIYSLSVGSGDPFFYRIDFDPENVEAPDITGLVDGKPVKLDFKPTDSHKLINAVSHSAGGTWLVKTADRYSAQDCSYVLHLWTEN